MDIEKLACFCRVYETRSFSKAANESYFSRQAVSKIIKAMESEWGVTLFERSTTYVTPTKDAEKAYSLAKRIVSTYQDLIGTFTSAKHGETVLRVAMANGVSHTLPGNILSDFTALYPDCRIVTKVTDPAACEELVARGQFDVALTTSPVAKPELRYLFLKREPLYFYGSRMLLDEDGAIKKGTSLFIFGKDFKHDRILLEEGHDLVEGLTIEDGFENYGLILEMTRLGSGVCVGPLGDLKANGEEGMFFLPIENARIQWEIILLMNSEDTMTSVAQEFVSYLMNADLK